MKIALFTNLDIPAMVALNHLLPRLHAHKVDIFYSEAIGHPNDFPAPLQQYQFIEQALFFDGLFPVIDEKMERLSPLKTFHQLLQKHHLQAHAVDDIDDPAVLSQLKKNNHELWISIRFGKIFKKEAIAIPDRGIINLHSGILPDFQGVMPTFRAMMAGENNIGCTLHYVNSEQIDAGPAIAFSKSPLEKERSYLWNVIHLYEAGVGLIQEAIAKLQQNQVLSVFNTPSGGHYYSFPDQETINDFFERGFKLYENEDLQLLFQSLLISKKE